MGAVGALSALLEDPGTEVNTMDDVGETPLHLAAAAGRTLAVQRLLEHGARVDPPSHHGYTPLHMAAQHGHLATAELLLQALTLSPNPNPNPNPLPYPPNLPPNVALAQSLTSPPPSCCCRLARRSAPSHASRPRRCTGPQRTPTRARHADLEP